jgi:MFS family permease
MAFIAEPVRKDRAGPLHLAAIWQHLRTEQARILRICLAIGVVAAGDYGLLSWCPTLLRARGMSPSSAAVLVGLCVSVAGIGASVGAGLISDRVVRRSGLAARPLVMLGAYALCLAAALSLTIGTNLVLVAALALWVFGSVAGNIVGFAVLQESVPNEMRATTIALCNLCSAVIGSSLGPSSVVLAARWLFEDAHALGPGMATVTLTAALAALALIGTIGLRSFRNIDHAKLAQ